ncbi:MAG: HAD-IIB family hydrolase [Candidatus Pacebacteria bacterium]|nr:HAD-IIB family hydrolase [Candidatus Paceibacterota bacterium]
MTLPTAIAFDSDNTLSISKQTITPEMAALLAKLTYKIPTAIISGAGMPQYLSQIISLLPAETCYPNLYLFPSTGAACFALRDGHWESIYTHTIPQEAALKVMQVVEQALSDTRVTAGEPRYGEIIENRGASIAVSALGQHAPVSAKEAWDPDHKKRELVVALIQPQLPDFEVRIGGMTTIDITLKGIDKGFAMRWFAEHLKVAIGSMLYVGDALYEGGNDASVIPTGIQTYSVENPSVTARVIAELLTAST